LTSIVYKLQNKTNNHTTNDQYIYESLIEIQIID